MTHSTDVRTLARWMAANFSNQAQAWENPPFFAHIHVFMRPLKNSVLDGPAFLVEQAYDYLLNHPYRTRVIKLLTMADHIQIENYNITNPERFYGATRDLPRMHSLTAADVVKMDGCNMIVDWSGHSFKGYVEPGKKCMVYRKDRHTYLDSTFELTANHFTSLDRGRDPETDEMVWGSVAGAFEFTPIASYADEVDL